MKPNIEYLGHRFIFKNSLAEYDRYSCEICDSIYIIHTELYLMCHKTATRYKIYDIHLDKINKLTCDEVLIKNIIE